MTACVDGIMRLHGASPQAISFFNATGLTLASFLATGVVDVGYTLTPYPMSGGGQGFMLLNGSPQFFVPPGPVLSDRAYAALRSGYRWLSVPFNDWPATESATTVSGGGQQLLLQYPLVRQCEACGIPYAARVAYDFSSTGVYEGAVQLGPCEGGRIGSMPAPLVSEPACPAAQQP